jgi:hypothetical protein
VSNYDQTTTNNNDLLGSSLPLFRVSFALDHASDVQIAHIESPDAAGVLQGMKQQFPSTYENILIKAIVESRKGDDTTVQ